MEEWGLATPAFRLAVALGLGLLAGLQREKHGSPLAGVRTFALAALLGGVAALLSEPFGGSVLAASVLGLAALLIMGNVAKLRAGYRDPGLTTEVALLLVFLLGAYLQIGSVELGVVLGGIIALLLHAKARFHGLIEQLGEEDVTAIMRFVLLSLVILPILPDQTFGPLDVLNPRNIWWMVVLIVGIGLGGYLAYRFLGGKAGTALAGILGGTISSTATTLSYSRQAGDGSHPPDLAAVVIMAASTVVFVRVLVEIAVVAPSALLVAAPPLLLLLVAFAALSWAAWRAVEKDGGTMPEQKNPSELGPALVFGALYAGVLMAIAAAQEWFGSQGLYVVSLLSGLTDMDAVTLSTGRLTQEGRVDPGTLWRVVMVASMANLVFKLALAGAIGGRALLKRLGPLYALGGAVAGLILFLWPG